MGLKRIRLAATVLVAAALVGGYALPTQSRGRATSAQEQAPQGERPRRRSPIPDTFSNLQVLPKAITKPELVGIMKGFSLTFDKNCSFCHVATDDLSEADFSSDEKETKKKARELLRLIRETQKTPASAP
ncbi:MAG: hypothetical protein ACRD4U_06760 [Candidatus Acidiferrales bacterium]